MLHRPGLAPLAAVILLAAQGWTAAPVCAQAQPPQATPAQAADPAAAVPADPYTVTGVAVDVTAASAAAARDKAIADGQRKAFAILFKRLTASQGVRVSPGVADADLQRMIQGFEIDREQGSAVRYVGSLSFKFRPRVVRTYLASLGITVAESAAPPSVAAAPGPAGGAAAAAAPAASLKPTLVLPVTRGANGIQLWEERTPWRAAWEDFSAAAGAAKLVVPQGELADVADIGAAEAIKGDPASLARIAGHYQAGDVVVAVLADADRLDPATGGSVAITRYGANGQPEGAADTVTVAANPGEAPGALLGRAVSTVVERLASLPRRGGDAVAPSANSGDGQIQVTVPITGMEDWLEVRRRLASNPMVSGVETQSLARSRVEVTLRYRGAPDALRAMLDRDALTLASGPAGWTLYLKSSVQPSAVPGPASRLPTGPLPSPGPSAPQAAPQPGPQAYPQATIPGALEPDAQPASAAPADGLPAAPEASPPSDGPTVQPYSQAYPQPYPQAAPGPDSAEPAAQPESPAQNDSSTQGDQPGAQGDQPGAADAGSAPGASVDPGAYRPR